MRPITSSARAALLAASSTFGLLAALASPCLGGESVKTSTVADRGGEILRLTLGPDLGDSWADAHVARLDIRNAGVQTRVDKGRFRASNHLDLRLEEGCSMVLVELGSPDDKGFADSWQRVRHSAKIVACRELDDPRQNLRERRRAGALTLSKVGGRLEIRPLMNPATVRPGSDLAVLVYVDNSPRSGARVWAEGPQGRRIAATTGPAGAANFRIPVHGAWRVVYRSQRDGIESTADLRFEVPSAEAWREMWPEMPEVGGAS